MEHEALSSVLWFNNLTHCFAGLEPDMPDATYRFISTGFPIFRTPHKELYKTNHEKIELAVAMDDFYAKFLYGKDNKLYVAYVKNIMISNYKMGDRNFRDSNKKFEQITAPIVCQPKWDGSTLEHWSASLTNIEIFHNVEVIPRIKRSPTKDRPKEKTKPVSNYLDTDGTKN